MTNKNTFRFATFAAVASLGLGLMISGCGDGGSTEPNSLTEVGQVTFNYKVLAAKAATARTNIAENIVTVKYAFYGVKNGGERFIADPTQAYTFTHVEEDKDSDITVPNVDRAASGVIAAYYDKDGKLVAIGENDLAFDADGKATVADPEVTDLANATYSMTASQYVIAPTDETVIGLTAVAGDKTYNVTPFATIEGIDEKVLAYVQDTNQGKTYKGAEYGTIKANTIKATVNGTAYAIIDKPIYVTDQTPNAIKIVADQVAGKDVTTVAATEGANEALTVVLAGEKSILASEEAVELTAEGKDALYYAVNEQPIAVIATGYTNVEGKGPQPEGVESEIKDTSKITLKSETEATAKAEGLNLIAAAEGNTVVTATYKVSDEETVESTNKLDVKVVSATENLAFSNTQTKAFMTDVKVDAENDQTFNMAVAGKASLTVDEVAYTSAPIEYTEKYPAIVAVDVEGITYAQAEGKNEYTLTVAKTAAPAKDVEITVAETTPAFESINVVKE